VKPSSRDRAAAAGAVLREASLELARLRRIRGASHKTWRRIARAQARLALAAALLAAAHAEPALAGTPSFRSLGPGVVSGLARPTFADIDGDGDLDAFVGSCGFTDFFENTGSAGAPAFSPSVREPFGLDDVPFDSGCGSPAFADIDGDGDLDAFVGEYYGNTFFFRNTGTATAPAFAAGSTSAFGLTGVGSGLGYATPELVDIDGDGDFDALIGDQDGNTNFFRNTGTALAPAFAAPATNPFGLANVGSWASPSLVDIDGDGDLDAFVGDYWYTYFFPNTGSASAPAFAAPSTSVFPLLFSRPSPAFADLDGDGDLDAFVGIFDGSTIRFENTGAASAPAFLQVPPNPFGFTNDNASSAFADSDEDGDLDAFFGDSLGNITFQENTGTATAPAFGARSTNPFGLADVGSNASPALADLDGDGDLDAFVGELNGSTLLFRNTGTASAPAFTAPSSNPFGLADVGSRATPDFADLDADGDLDALVGNGAGNTLFFQNTGTAAAPAFATPSTNPFGLSSVLVNAAPTFVDADRDGDLDVFVGLLFFRNSGTASAPAFAAGVLQPFGLHGASAPFPAFPDIDGDGDPDALIGVHFFENVELGPGTCDDGLDNDGDGRFDAADPGCNDAADTSEKSQLQCDNGVDDDGDGKIDWRGDGSGDPQCTSLQDGSEFPPPPLACGLGPELALVAPLLAAARRRWRAR